MLAARGQRENEGGGTVPVTEPKERILLSHAGRRILFASAAAAVVGGVLGWMRATHGA